MTRRPRVPKRYEQLELAARAVIAALELASLGVFAFLSVNYWDQHATNPVAYAGVSLFTCSVPT